MPWLRLWIDVLDDPDLCELPEATCWGWALMLAAAKKFNRTGELPPLKILAHWMHKPTKTVSGWIAQLTKAGLVESVDGKIIVHGWNRWQMAEDRTNAERQARFRAKQKISPLDSPLPPKQIQRQRQTQKPLRNAVTSESNGDVTLLLPPTDRPPTASFSSWEEENAADWREALNVLRARADTVELADLIEASRDPRIQALTGLQALIASHAIQKPGKRIPKTLDGWRRCGEVANDGDIAALQRPAKPEPVRNGSGDTITPSQRIDSQDKQPPTAAEKAEMKKRLKELKAIKKPSPWETAEAQSIREELAR